MWYGMSNMSETPTSTPNPEYPTSDERYADQAWQDNKDIQDSLAAAQRINQVDQPVASVQPEAKPENRVSVGTKIGASAAIVAAVAAGPAIIDRLDGPEFPDTTTPYTFESSDGLQNAAEAVPGASTVDIREVTSYIASHPANIEALKDGAQPGETIVIPTSVEP